MKLKFASLPVMRSIPETQIRAHAVMLVFTLTFFPLASFAGASSNNTANTSNPTLAAAAGSCNNTASGFCNEFTGASYKVERVKRSCKKVNGVTYLVGACPTDKRIGTCLVYKGKNTESKYRYYKNYPGFGIQPAGGVALAAEKQCVRLKGEWIAN